MKTILISTLLLAAHLTLHTRAHITGVTLEYSTDGVEYHSIGTLDIPSPSKTNIVHITPHSRSVQHTVTGRMLHFRLPATTAANSPYVHSSVPASCVSPGMKLTLDLQSSAATAVTALSVQCASTHVSSSSSSSSSSPPSVPEISQVYIRSPVEGLEPLTNMIPVGGNGQKGNEFQIPLPDQGQQQQQHRQGQGKGKGGREQPPDERTWLQKNWLFLVVIGFMMFNRIANLDEPVQPPGVGGGGGQGGGGGAVVPGGARPPPRR